MEKPISALPVRSPYEVTALEQNPKWAISMFLSKRDAEKSDSEDKNQFQILNSQYDVRNKEQAAFDVHYLLEIEQKLQKMILVGDKQGARELIMSCWGICILNRMGILR